MSKRIERVLRKELEGYGLDTSAYAAHIWSVYEHDPALLRCATFYRQDGAAIQVDDIYTNRQGYPVQWNQPVLTGINQLTVKDYDEQRNEAK